MCSYSSSDFSDEESQAMKEDQRMHIPVVLFAYKRLDTLRVTLDSLRKNNVGLLIVYSDAAKSEADVHAVNEVRELISQIDWCDTELHFAERNKGLGQSIKDGLDSVFSRFEAAIVCEDDLEFVEGTLKYLAMALAHYANDRRVMSVTGYTNANITPGDVGSDPYFDGRFECWLWGTWRRVWKDMQSHTALEMMNIVKDRGEDPYAWGGDLPYMAKTELRGNIWAVRMCYLHIMNHGLCLRPPWSMVNHIGWGDGSTNCCAKNWEYNGVLKNAPPIPAVWPEPLVNNGTSRLNRMMYKRPWADVFPRMVPLARRWLRRMGIKA